MFKKLFVLAFLLLTINIGLVSAAERTAGGSASVSPELTVPQVNRISYASLVLKNNLKKRAVAQVLARYDSPMSSALDSFFSVCDDNTLDCYLLPSIAGLESSFGKALLPNSYNPFGWGRGYIRFNNWNKAIETVGTGLKQNYIGRGAISVEQIGPIYSESPTWAVRVRHFMAEFESAEQKNQQNFSSLALQL